MITTMGTTLSETMQAIRLVGHGGNEVVELAQCPKPRRQEGEVLVRMLASSLNQVDLYMRNSGAGITHVLPQIMGLEGCGVIEACDADSGLYLGQRVVLYPGVTCGRCEFCERGEEVLCTRMALLGEHRHGTWAQWVSVPARNALPAPAHLSDEQAATLGVTYLTAWRMLVTQAQLQPNETVLIMGIGGGVSLAGLQLAKAMGARCIVASRHAHKLRQAMDMGADHGIDVSQQDVVEQVMQITQRRGVDVVFENVGAALWSAAMKSLVRGGRLVTCGATTGDQPAADLRRIFIRQLRILGSTLGNRQEMLDMMAFMQTQGLKPHIDECVEPGDIHQALTKLERSAQFGKLVLRLSPLQPPGC